MTKVSKSSKIQIWEECKVCGAENVQGRHFDVRVCRACAVFFRRHAGSKYVTQKCASAHCDGKPYLCKPCRLDRCYEVGMNMDKFQYNRDTGIIKAHAHIPNSVSQFVGRPDLVIFCIPSSSNAKTFVDLKPLISCASKIFRTGSETPLTGGNQLEKLTIGLRSARKSIDGSVFERIARRETAKFWEFYVLRTAKWLTYFDEFQLVPHEIKMQLLLSVWHVFGRLDKLSATARMRKLNVLRETERAMAMSNGMIMHLDKTIIDFSWMSTYPQEQILYFLNSIAMWDLFPFINYLIDLDVSEVELTFMMAQLAFEYAAKRFPGDVAKICERLQETLANDLHSYYVNVKRMPRYSGRLARMMKVNNAIQKDILLNRPRGELASLFHIFSIEFSHPDMFFDTGFA